MQVLILGSGVIGVTSAYYLAQAGHDVTVIDRRPGPALETSFGNAGEISPGYASPWASPSVPLKALKWLFMKHSPLVLRPRADPAQWRWILAMLRNCTPTRYALNKSRMVRLAEYSRDMLGELRRETQIRYDERCLGTLQLFRTEKQLHDAASDIAVLKEYGVAYELLDPAGCIGAEPALAAVQEKFVGGLRLPGDETGDCYKFTVALAERAANIGVKFQFDTPIEGLAAEGGRITGVNTRHGRMQADAYLVAFGSYSPLLLRPLGIRLPVYPVKGYSITVPITDPDSAPVSTVMDETYKIAITRLGDRIRVGGTAELSGYDQSLPPQRRETLEHSVGDLFPKGGDLSRATFWCGHRPMTPDSTPVLGPTNYPNLYLNTGHGTLGWTMSCGSGKVIADLMSGKTPDIETADLTLARYGGR